MMTDPSRFDDFWQASSLDPLTIREFAERLNSYEGEDKELLLEYAPAAVPLPPVKSRLNKIASSRKSSRAFSPKPLSDQELSLVLSSFQAINGLEHRSYPSAGAMYATEIFCVSFNTDRGMKGQIYYYDPETHGLVESGRPPLGWERAEELLNIEVDGRPQLLILIISFPERLTVKYGEDVSPCWRPGLSCNSLPCSWPAASRCAGWLSAERWMVPGLNY
jgi:hypothetical protein